MTIKLLCLMLMISISLVEFSEARFLKKRDVCSSITCNNGGVCVQVQDNIAMCACRRNFRGAACQFALNGTLVTDAPTTTTTTTIAASTTLNPSTITLCKSNLCKNGGICVMINNLGLCACPPDLSGMFCQIDSRGPSTTAQSTTPLPTLPAETTTSTTTSTTTTTTTKTTATTTLPTTVVATTTFTVPVQLKVCESTSCQNGGSCFIVSNNLGFCVCANDFHGPNCEFKQQQATTIAPATVLTTGNCVASPCLNDNPCLSINGKETCFCATGYEPPFCSSPTHAPGATTAAASVSTLAPEFVLSTCTTNPCLNNQRCVAVNQTPVCICDPGFLAPLCTAAGTTTTQAVVTGVVTGVSLQCSPNPCHNNQQCIALTSGPVCLCTGTFQPPLCD